MHDPALSTSTVAQILQVTPERVRQLDREGVFPAAERDSSGRRIYRLSEVERFRRRREQLAEALANVG